MSSSPTATGSPSGGPAPGQAAPLAALTPTNQSGIILIAASLAVIFAVISSLIRLFIRMEFRQKFGYDDFASFAALAFFGIQSSAVFLSVSKGLGKAMDTLSPDDAELWQKDAYVSDLFYIITMWLSKCSAVCLFLRLSPDKRHALSSYATLTASTALMVVSLFVVAIRCNFSEPWIFVEDAKCTDLYARWQAVTAFDVITELALFAISIFMVSGLHLPFAKKAVVIFAFGLRLPVIVPSILRLHYLGVEFSSSDPSLRGVMAAVCTQTELSYAIIATTTPCLRPFMGALSTHYGGTKEVTTSPSGSKATALSNQEYSLGSVSTRTRTARATDEKRVGEPSPGRMPKTRWDVAEYNVNVVSADQRSLHSSESRQMIISKNTEWAIDYEEPRGSSRGT